MVDGSQIIHKNIVLAFFSRSSCTFSWRLSQMIQKSFVQKKQVSSVKRPSNSTPKPPMITHSPSLQNPNVTSPWKINMEPTNHPFRKENDLPNLHDYVPF